MNIPIEQGEMFAGTNQVIVDRKLQKTSGEDVVGKMFSMDIKSYTVKGMCSTYRYSLYDSGGAGIVFFPRKESAYIGHCYLKCTLGEVKNVQKYIEGILKDNLPSTIDYSTSTLMEDIREMQVIEHTFRKIFIFFAIVCILITLLGVWSSISMDTDKRVKEVAIMKVCGAMGRDIAWRFTKLYVVLLGTSALIAFPLVYLLFHFLKRLYVQFFHYGILFWTILFISLASLVALTIAWKIGRVVRLNPAEVIKSE